MDQESLRSFVNSHPSSTNVASAVKDAINTEPKPKTVDDNNDEKFLEDNLNWIHCKLNEGKDLVTIKAGTYFFHLSEVVTNLKKILPIDYVSLGGMYWFVKTELDTWLNDIKLYNEHVIVLGSKSGSSLEFHPDKIFDYDILHQDTLN